MPEPIAIGIAGRSILASAGRLLTSGRGGRTYNQILAETLQTGVPNGKFRDNTYRDYWERNGPSVPVGRGGAGRPNQEPAVYRVPEMAAKPPRIPEIATPRASTGQAPALDQSKAPKAKLPVTIMPVPKMGIGINPTGDKPMDLGTLITDLGGAYIGARYGSPTPPPQQFVDMPSIGVPFVDVVPEARQKGMVWNPEANCGQGKWQKKRRRRRSRLATPTDIKDLSSLKGVLGSGEAFKVWIATHSN